MSTATRRPATEAAHHLLEVATGKPTGRVAARVVGGFFGVCAVGNMAGTLPQARAFLEWCRDSAWLPPYEWVLGNLVDAAPVVVVATATFEAGVAALLLSRRHESLAYALATAWVLGLIPALGWPYWTVNVAQAVGYGELCRRARARR